MFIIDYVIYLEFFLILLRLKVLVKLGVRRVKERSVEDVWKVIIMDGKNVYV